MTKKQFDFEKLSNLKPKKTEATLDAEKAVESIHKKPQDKERVKRVTLDLPFSVYTAIRKKTIDEDQTLKDYFLRLAEKNLEEEC